MLIDFIDFDVIVFIETIMQEHPLSENTKMKSEGTWQHFSTDVVSVLPLSS